MAAPPEPLARLNSQRFWMPSSGVELMVISSWAALTSQCPPKVTMSTRWAAAGWAPASTAAAEAAAARPAARVVVRFMSSPGWWVGSDPFPARAADQAVVVRERAHQNLGDGAGL